MPYKVFPSGKGFKVFKLGTDGKKTGEGMSDKPLTEEQAKRQMSALYANEKKPKKEAEPLTYTTTGGAVNVTVTQPADTEETKEADHEKMYYGDPVPVIVAEVACGPLTFADLMAEEAVREATYEMYNLTDQFSRLSRNIMNSDIEDKAAALVALAKEYETLVSEKAQLEIEDKSATIAKQIAGNNQPDTSKSTSQSTDQNPETTDAPGGDSEHKSTTDTQDLFIWKEGDVYRWLAAYSNNRRDCDNPPEIISSESHKEFDEALNKGEWPMPELWPWHVPFPVGVATFHAYDEEKGFPIAGGYFYKGMEWIAEGMMQAGWDGVSHGMPKEWIARDEADPTILKRHRTKEISPLPTWAAANKLAFTIISKEQTMADEKGLPVHKRDEFIKAFGEERVTQIEAALADKAKEADDAGIEKKEQGEAQALPAGEIVKGLTFLADQIKTLSESMDNRLKALEGERAEEKEAEFDLVAMLKSKSAIGKQETKVDGRSSLAKDGPEEAQAITPTQQTVGVPVGLLDGLFQLNQGWYSGGKG